MNARSITLDTVCDRYRLTIAYDNTVVTVTRYQNTPEDRKRLEDALIEATGALVELVPIPPAVVPMAAHTLPLFRVTKDGGES